MDNNTQKPITDKKYAVTVFIWLFLFTAVFAVIGAYVSDRFGILDGISFYGRYDGLTSSFATRANAVLISSVSCLVQLMFLYMLSYSALLIPGSVIITGLRGFMLGASYSIADSAAEFIQIAAYAVICLGICITTSKLTNCRKESVGTAVAKKTIILTATAGFSVITEFLLSFMI